MPCRLAALVAGLLVLTGCSDRGHAPVERVGGSREASGMTLAMLRGIRDGDRLRVRARFAGAGEDITLELQFRIGVPTRLESGAWRGFGEAGSVRELSTTFLGGQSGPPSLGGRYDLLGPADSVRYRVRIPVRELRFGI
ncbi:MAG: hypothetical protein IT160_17375 [Bryobacterales bacterium]|nr:hypothetical protein [Bryobacterales bacterium]